MKKYKIIGIDNPVDDEDAVNKLYVTGRVTALTNETEELRREYTDKCQKSIDPILKRMFIFDKVNKIIDNRILPLSYSSNSYFIDEDTIGDEFDPIDGNRLNRLRNTLSIFNDVYEWHDLSGFFLEGKNHLYTSKGKYLIFKQSGKYTINFDLPHNNCKIVIGHGFQSGPDFSDQDPSHWTKYNITESTEMTINVSDEDTMVFMLNGFNGSIFPYINFKLHIYYILS